MKNDCIENRGSLERYTALMVELFRLRKKLTALKGDIDECFSPAASRLWESGAFGENSAIKSLKQIEERIISLVSKNMEEVQCLMSKKKQLITRRRENGSSGPLILKGEEDFFNKAAADIGHTADQVDVLVKNALALFQDIKRHCEDAIDSRAQLKGR